ncbi:MAG: aconitate hydratase 1 [Candidatus Peregrinibacteria bacterium Greene0416_19]|nr:MAG: aconitate hydratase 1 [Candidatus Peregrinibacteria bacterium Greene0416_19]
MLVENSLRNVGDGITMEDVTALGRWNSEEQGRREIAFSPGRILMQDFTGVPAFVELAAARDEYARQGGNPERINPAIPVDLVIDHSVQVDNAGTAGALQVNTDLEFQRNRQRYEFLKWAAKAFTNVRVVPPGMGIVHQVNMEHLADVVTVRSENGTRIVMPDTLVGTDSHTTMINGMGVLGWGVGGIEAEAALLGQRMSMLMPEVIGVELRGELPEGTTATDLVLTVTETLRQENVVGKFVEFYGAALRSIPLADRATIANMAPEYGATVGFFPIDDQTLRYLRLTGRSPSHIDLVERYAKEQALFRDETVPRFTDGVSINLSAVQASVAGPDHPSKRVSLADLPRTWNKFLLDEKRRLPRSPESTEAAPKTVTVERDGEQIVLKDGSIVIAAITSCTNTSNPSVMIAAGLLAKKAVERGLTVPPHVKTSLAPGSRTVTDYLREAGLLSFLEQLNFHVVGYGCTTCIGNSGPLPAYVEKGLKEGDIVGTAVLSGNRNFAGRVHHSVAANYLASPPLVVAYALKGDIADDLLQTPIGTDRQGSPVFLRDIWPSQEEVQRTMERVVTPDRFTQAYATLYDGSPQWNALDVGESSLYPWDETNTYIQRPPFFDDLDSTVPDIWNIAGARALLLLGDQVTTDHISPAGNIPPHTPAGTYLQGLNIQPSAFNTYGARRGNDRVMERGTFASLRIRNALTPQREGGVTVHLPSGAPLPVYDAAKLYKQEGIPTIVIAGKEYGTGSSRDWAAKGTLLLGVKAVLAESFERIHRSNLVGMGVLPLQFKEGQSARSLGWKGTEVFDITGLDNDLQPGHDITVTVTDPDTGSSTSCVMTARVDNPTEVLIYRHGGILKKLLRTMMSGH